VAQKDIFASPGAITTKMQDSVWNRPPSLCKMSAKSVSSFGGDLSRTHRQTEKQTANLISPVTVGDITIKQMAIPYLKLTEMLSLSEQNVGISIELQYICKQASVFAK